MSKTHLKVTCAILSLCFFTGVQATVNTSHCSSVGEIGCKKKAYKKAIVIQKGKLRNTYRFSESKIVKLDSIIEKYSTQEKKLRLLDSRLETVIPKLGNSLNHQKAKAMLVYLQYKVQYHLNEIAETEKFHEVGEMYGEQIEPKVINESDTSVVADISKTDVTEVDIKNLEVQEMILYDNELQKMSLDELKEITEGLDINDLYGDKYDQFSKATPRSRDTGRITALKSLEAVIEVYFTDNGVYPTFEETKTTNFTNLLYKGTFPEDPLAGTRINGCDFGFRYEVGTKYGVDQYAYRLSACLEDSDKALNDGGDDPLRYETGNYSDDTVFGDAQYINGISHWTEAQVKTFEGSSDKHKREFYLHAIGAYYVEHNKEKIEEYFKNENKINYNDSKITSDIRYLAIAIETTRIREANPLAELVKEKTIHTVTIAGEEVTVYQGTIDFDTIKQDASDFLTPDGDDYAIAYITGTYFDDLGEEHNYGFYQIGALNSKGDAVIKGNYYQIDTGDSETILKLK